MKESLVGIINNYFEISKNEVFQNNEIIESFFNKIENDVKDLLKQYSTPQKLDHLLNKILNTKFTSKWQVE